jgi:glutathione S-transferase
MFKLYAFSPTRSARPKWILQELGLTFEEVDGKSLVGTPEYRKLHPLGKLPALDHNGKIIFESVAIVNYLADMHPGSKLIPAAGTYERALHDQWSCFALAELEAWVWSNVKHQHLYPEEKRVPGVVKTNTEEFQKAAGVVDAVLAKQPYILGDQFSAADINLSYVLNWGRASHVLGEQRHVGEYLDRLQQRPASTLAEQAAFFKKK